MNFRLFMISAAIANNTVANMQIQFYFVCRHQFIELVFKMLGSNRIGDNSLIVSSTAFDFFRRSLRCAQGTKRHKTIAYVCKILYKLIVPGQIYPSATSVFSPLTENLVVPLQYDFLIGSSNVMFMILSISFIKSAST